MVEHTIGILKQRFSRLQDGFSTRSCKPSDHKFVVDLIEAAVISHNICMNIADDQNEMYLAKSVATSIEVDAVDVNTVAGCDKVKRA